jgi:flagellar M-ring protein FliF
MHTSVVIDNGENFLGADVIQQVNNLVSAAIGFDAARGDLISVESMSFDRSLEEKMDTALAEMEQQQRREQLIRQAVLGGAVLVAFVLLMLLLRRRRRLQSEEEEAIPADRGPSLEQLLALEEREDYLPEMSLESSPQARARKMVETHPDVAASVLRSWMVEE